VLAFWGINSFPDFCGVAGFFVAVVGLLATWNEARKARTAAEAAAEAAAQMREDLDRFDIVRTMSETMAALEEVKTLQRYGVWELLPANYSGIKKGLLTVKRSAPSLTNSHRRKLQSALQTCSSIEDSIETALSADEVPADVAGMNRALSIHIMNLHELLLHVRTQIGEE
jgi:hypothetical protein